MLYYALLRFTVKGCKVFTFKKVTRDDRNNFYFFGYSNDNVGLSANRFNSPLVTIFVIEVAVARAE